MPNFGKAYKIDFYRGVTKAIADEPYLTILSDQTNMLRISFEIKKSSTANCTANSMILRIYNLSQGTREAISDTQDFVRLRAGWRDRPLPIVYQGTALAVNHRVEQPDAITEVSCLDESAALSAQNAKATVAISAAVSVRSVIEIVAKEALLDIAQNDASPDVVLNSGYASSDKSAINVLKDLANRAECFANILDSKLYVMSKKDPISSTEVIEIRESTGMIGYAQRFGYSPINPIFVGLDAKRRASSWRVATQLNGDLNPFRVVRIVCPALKVDGQLASITALVHQGDTHGALWRTTAETYEV
jgi:hypothetical protein